MVLDRAAYARLAHELDQPDALERAHVVRGGAERGPEPARKLHGARCALLEQREDAHAQRMAHRLDVPRVVDGSDRVGGQTNGHGVIDVRPSTRTPRASTETRPSRPRSNQAAPPLAIPRLRYLHSTTRAFRSFRSSWSPVRGPRRLGTSGRSWMHHCFKPQVLHE